MKKNLIALNFKLLVEVLVAFVVVVHILLFLFLLHFCLIVCFLFVDFRQSLNTVLYV